MVGGEGGREEGEQVTLMERQSPNTRGLQERGNKAPGEERKKVRNSRANPDRTNESKDGELFTQEKKRKKRKNGKIKNKRQSRIYMVKRN